MFSYKAGFLPSKIIPALYENTSPGSGTGKRPCGRALLFRVVHAVVQQSAFGFITQSTVVYQGNYGLQ